MSPRRLSIAVLSLLLTACGGGNGSGGGPAPILEVIKWTPSGDNQTDTVGQTLPSVIRVKVTLDGEVVSGITVKFDAGLAGGIVGTPSMVTGSTGIATSTWTLGPFAGPKTVTVTVDSAVGSPITFHATAVAGPPVSLIQAVGDSQVADTNQIFPSAFSVRIVDAFANGVAGRYVHWSRTGSLTLAIDSIITDQNGFSNMFAKAGVVQGPITVTATVDSLAGSPITFIGAVVAAPTKVTVGSNFFNPASLSIPAGAEVNWVWAGSGHSVTSYGANTFTSSGVLNAGATYGPIQFNTPGVYTYRCSVHPTTMLGTITVN